LLNSFRDNGPGNLNSTDFLGNINIGVLDLWRVGVLIVIRISITPVKNHPKNSKLEISFNYFN
jgi:hypothetical protein